MQDEIDINGGIEDVAEFYAHISRESLTKKISTERPYVYVTMELYDAKNGIKGGGGLGVLAADTRRVARMLNVPFLVMTPFYPSETHQKLGLDGQIDEIVERHPSEFGFDKTGVVNITTFSSIKTHLEIWEKILGSTKILTMYEPGFGLLYSGNSNGDHRLYQCVALGFGGYAALKQAGAKPAVIQLNEVATFFAALARLDELCSSGMNLYEAIVYVRKHTLYTNHTLVQAAESEYTLEQFENYVRPNLNSPAVWQWVKEFFENGKLKLSKITIEIAEAKNCVSKLHAKVANYHDVSGEKVKFKAITNGIDMNTWVMPETLEHYRSLNILDKFNLPNTEALSKLAVGDMRQLKRMGRSRLNLALQNRVNQYGEALTIPDDVILYNFKRRFADYKRPDLAFKNIEILKRLLVTHNAYYILTGKVHSGDLAMSQKLNNILEAVKNDPELKKRVFYIEDYDEELAYALSIGSDVTINVPVVGLEACGTSWEKDIANLVILISTNDGGVADISPPACLEVAGDTEDDEMDSLYEQMDTAAKIIKNDFLYDDMIKFQLSNYLPIISGTRMMKDYLRYLFDEE